MTKQVILQAEDKLLKRKMKFGAVTASGASGASSAADDVSLPFLNNYNS